MRTNNKNKQLIFEMNLDSNVEQVYNAWSTEEGIKTFFAPDCEVEVKLYGKYHIHFFPDNEPGSRGTEDELLIAHEPNKMISFTWGFALSLKDLRQNQKTIVLIRFEEVTQNKTGLIFIQSGWGESDERQKGFDYFSETWGKVVLARLKYRFKHGPVDWNNLPDLTDYEIIRKTD
jgi:uncharacterized protein YndB with AHSA1/START domain